MRTIKFRGKSLNTGMWVYGDLQHKGRRIFVEYEVDPATVGQYTGLKDKNGREIYEGDIICLGDKAGSQGPVVWYDSDCSFVMEKTKTGSLYKLYARCSQFKYEVIGNIHDNPELLKGGDQ